MRVLIAGGVQTLTGSLLNELLTLDSIESIKIIDKFAINEKVTTTFIDDYFKELLAHQKVDYQQANLLNKGLIDDLFNTFKPTSVYDMTGDIRFDINELQHIQSTLISYQLGTIASNHNLHSYVKLTYPFYNFNSKPSSESVELTPQGERGIWWHESIRSLSSISNLPLVVLRIGAWYGPFQLNGKITPRIICADIYRHLKEDIKFLWNADLRLNTIHSQDVARALIALSNWRADTPDVNPQSVNFKSYAPVEKLKQFDLPQLGTAAKAPLFNLVDDSDATQSSVADQIAKVFKVKTSFLGGLISTFARMDMEEMVQDVNEMHLDAWSDMLKKSDIKDTPLTPYLDEHFFKKNPIALDASKISKTIGFKCLHKSITVEDIEGIVKGFRDQGIWPKPV